MFWCSIRMGWWYNPTGCDFSCYLNRHIDKFYWLWQCGDLEYSYVARDSCWHSGCDHLLWWYNRVEWHEVFWNSSVLCKWFGECDIWLRQYRYPELDRITWGGRDYHRWLYLSWWYVKMEWLYANRGWYSKYHWAWRKWLPCCYDLALGCAHSRYHICI